MVTRDIYSTHKIHYDAMIAHMEVNTRIPTNNPQETYKYCKSDSRFYRKWGKKGLHLYRNAKNRRLFWKVPELIHKLGNVSKPILAVFVDVQRIYKWKR